MTKNLQMLTIFVSVWKKRGSFLQTERLIWEYYRNLGEEHLSRLSENAKLERYEKGELLLEEGSVQTQLPILVSGMFRGYVLDQEGRDVTDWFAYHRGSPLIGCYSIGERSHVNIAALSHAECLLVPVEQVAQQYEDNIAFIKEYNQLLQRVLHFYWRGKMSMHCCTAMQRYQQFLREYPGLINTVNNKYIASFLGMTPVTLSRLRRQLREEEEETKFG